MGWLEDLQKSLKQFTGTTDGAAEMIKGTITAAASGAIAKPAEDIGATAASIRNTSEKVGGAVDYGIAWAGVVAMAQVAAAIATVYIAMQHGKKSERSATVASNPRRRRRRR
jgi:hypothetical protein